MIIIFNFKNRYKIFDNNNSWIIWGLQLDKSSISIIRNHTYFTVHARFKFDSAPILQVKRDLYVNHDIASKVSCSTRTELLTRRRRCGISISPLSLLPRAILLSLCSHWSSLNLYIHSLLLSIHLQSFNSIIYINYLILIWTSLIILPLLN